MKRFVFPLLVLLLAGLFMTESKAADFFPYQYQIYTLDNGLKAYLIPVHGSGLVAYYSIVRTGSRDEWEPGKSGFAHFFEHMMFRGTKKYPGPVYDRMVTEMGADANAYTTDDYTAFHMVFPAQFLEKVVDLESDRFEHLSYSESDFKTEAGAVYGEFRKGRVNPWWVLEENLYDLAFVAHTYKHTTIGFEADIKNMPNMYDYSLSFFKRYYRPENVVLIVTGDFEPEQAQTLIKKYYADWKKGYVAPQIKKEPEQTKERSKEVTYPGKTLPILADAYKGPAFNPEDKMVAGAYLLGDLAFGKNSELYKKLVLDEQKVEFIADDFSYHRDPNLLIIYTMVKNSNDISYVQGEINHTIEKFKSEAVSESRLNDFKDHVRYSFLMNLDTPDHIAGRLARFVALTGSLESVDELFSTMQQLTPDDIRAVANRYLQSTRSTVITLEGEQQ